MQQTSFAFLGWPELLILFVLLGGMTAVVAVVIVLATRKKPGSVPPPIPPPARDLEQELRLLARLKDQGLITEEEFKLKKKVLLGI